MEDLKNLIDRIHEEGVRAVEEKTSRIEEDARKRREQIIEDARVEAGRILEDAGKKAEESRKRAEEELRQSARDLIIKLKETVFSVLDSLIENEIGAEFKDARILKTITPVIEKMGEPGEDKIALTVSAKERKRLEEALLSGLKDEIKKGVAIKESDEIGKGFLISFDGGRSTFDVTAKGLAEYVSRYMKPRLRDMLKDLKF